MKRKGSDSDMRGIYLRSLVAVFGIAMFIAIELLVPGSADALPAAPSAPSSSRH